MRTIKARKACRDELRQLLIGAGLLEGIGMTDEEIESSDKTIFWHGVVRNQKARNKAKYVSYYFPSVNDKYNADNDDFIREVIVAVDVFSKRSFDSQDNMDLLELLENTFKDNGFDVEFADEIFEDETSLFHYPITIYKLY